MATQTGSQATRHTALSFSHALASDISPDVFEWVFSYHIFQRWYRRDRNDGNWQLHCIGGPGTGKTTLAVLVATRLETQLQADSGVVLSVFVQEDVLAYESSFLEDFLEAVYLKLAATEADYDDYESYDLYCKYIQERGKAEGCKVSKRIGLIRAAVYSVLSSVTKSVPAYLVLDGLDRCSSTLRLLMDAELSQMQKSGLGVFLTSRLAVFEQIEARCDHRNHLDAPDDDPIPQEDREILDICLLCRKCDHVLCFGCRKAGRICGPCGNNDRLEIPYEHINVRIDQIPSHRMAQFISWSLEREHGDLGLGSSARKPPLSPLGLSLLEERTQNSIQAMVDRMVELVSGNIGLAKARLDLIHEVESTQDVEARRDQLPANIVAMFDAGIKRIEAQDDGMRDLGLKAIAAAGRDFHGVSIPSMQRLLHQSISVETRSGEDILAAANGFLFATLRDNPQKLQLYHTTFYYYAVQRYNVGLFRADSQLTADARRKGYDFNGVNLVPKARFEPLTVSEEPTEITSYKLSRTVTALEPIEEAFI